MDREIYQRKAQKRAIRQREVKLLSEGKVSAMALGEKNFCMSGIKLSGYQKPDGSFDLF
jgi:hypothetical protein